MPSGVRAPARHALAALERITTEHARSVEFGATAPDFDRPAVFGAGLPDEALHDVTAISSDDVWAVGTFDGGGSRHSLIVHWDGSSWSRLPTPVTRGSDNSELRSVVGISASDVWAVGMAWSDPLILHWDGDAWSGQQANSDGWDILEFGAITATSPKNLWLLANGVFDEEGGPDGALIERWNGTEWVVEYVQGQVYLNGISGAPRDDAWAGGSDRNARPLVLHWSDGAWTRVDQFPTRNGSVSGIAARADDDVWMVGIDRANKYHAAIWHYDGATWTTVATAPPKSALTDVDVVSADDAWAVGWAGHFLRHRCLLEHWDGTDWTATAGCARF